MSTTPSSQHTCQTTGRSSCERCVKFEIALWDAINRYVVACGGDPAVAVHGNTARMQAVADVGSIVLTSTGPGYEVARELAATWRSERTASFELLDRLAAHLAGGKT